MTSVELKTFTYSAVPKSLSIDNAVLRQNPQRLLFTMFRNNHLVGSLVNNTYYFQHFNLSRFTLFYNGKPISSEGLAMNVFQENPRYWSIILYLRDRAYFTRKPGYN